MERERRLGPHMWGPLLMVACCLATLACGERVDEAPPPAAALEPPSAGIALDSTLLLLERELDGALGDGVGDEESNQRLINAEIVSDRLLESALPFEWLTEQRYSVEAKLRQIQNMADRVVARIRVNAPRDGVVEDAVALRERVVELRNQLRQGGGDAPAPLRDLLEGGDTSRVESS